MPAGVVLFEFLRQLDVCEHNVDFEMDFMRKFGDTFEEWSQDYEISSAIHAAEITLNFASHMLSEPWSVFGSVPIGKALPPRSSFLVWGTSCTNSQTNKEMALLPSAIVLCSCGRDANVQRNVSGAHH